MSKFKGACGELWVVVLYWDIGTGATHLHRCLLASHNNAYCTVTYKDKH